MRFDKTQRSWLITTVMITVISSVGYIFYANTIPGGPDGGSVIGLVYGFLGTAMILFAGFLGGRKKLILLRVGSLSWWMRGHLWLGALSLPMILFHAAFSLGGLLTSTLMWLLFIIIISGVIGAIFQHALPGVMTDQVNKEHTYEQSDKMRWGFRLDAYELVASVCGPLEEASQERTELEANIGSAPKEPKKIEPVEGDAAIKNIYIHTILPYLHNPKNVSSPLTSATGATMLFDNLKPRVDPSKHDIINDLANICSELHQQTIQIRLHRILHGWLLLHIPLSMALMVLLLVHAVMALYY